MSPDDICMWPDGTWCYRSELSEYSHMSDDYEVYPEGSQIWAAVTDDWAGAVGFAIAEPLAQHAAARNLILGHGGRDVFNEPLSHMQPTRGRVVVHCVGQRVRRARQYPGL